MATNSQDPAKNLSLLALFIANDVRNAMEASFTTFVADALFQQITPNERKARFRTNPANTLVYTGLKALVEGSIVRIFEALKDEHGLHPYGIEIRRKRDIQGHRHALSHPMAVNWDRPWMQEFRDAGRDGSDWRPAQVWDLQRSMNESLRLHGLPPRNDSLQVTQEMGVSLLAILDSSRQPEFAAPTVADLLAWMSELLPKYQAAMEKHPDGMRDPKREQERASQRRARAKRWSEQKETKPGPDPSPPIDGLAHGRQKPTG